MNPTSYTLKSLLGPAMLVIAAYWFGQAAGRRERKR